MKELVAMACPEHMQPLLRCEEDAYVCPRGCRYPIASRIPRFVPEVSYADSFGLQWNAFRRVQLDSFTGTTLSRDRLTRIAGGALDVFRSRTVLEAGCGAGRFTELMLQAGARVFAVDLSRAVEANLRNCSRYEDYFVCQADIRRLPVLPGSFDAVVCIGVIQHTPDPEEAMAKLCSNLRSGGWLYMDHYPPDYPTTPSRRVLRWFLLRTSPRFALGFCSALTGLLWPVHRLMARLAGAPSVRSRWWVRKARAALLYLSPVVDYQLAYPELGPQLLRAWAVLDTHDTLTDRFKHVRSESQIHAHLKTCGMEEIHTHLGGNGVEARARRL